MNIMLETQVTEAHTAKTDRPKLGIRTGSSRKLLVRKAMEKATKKVDEGETLEASFPADSGPADLPTVTDNPAEPTASESGAPSSPASPSPADAPATAVQAPPAPPAPAGPPAPTPAPAWSHEDESTFQTLAARRRAAGYQRRGRDVGEQVITVGTIKPNPNTAVAVIVGIVAERGSIGRAELVDAMATAVFPHPKAQPTDKDWCQGYVAGAIRNGFLALAEQPAAIADAA